MNGFRECVFFIFVGFCFTWLKKVTINIYEESGAIHPNTYFYVLGLDSR